MSKKTISYRNFYTYSLIKTLYLKGKTYLDTFSPFILNSIKDKYINLDNLTSKIKETYGLIFPSLTLQNILRKLKKNGYVDFDDTFEAISLTEKGRKGFSEYIEDNKLVYGELENLFKEISLYIYKITGKKYEDRDIYKYLEHIINYNFAFFIKYFNPCNNLENIKSLNGVSKDIIKFYIGEFVIDELNNKTKNYEVIKKISYGALMSSVLTNNTIINDNSQYNFKNLFVYLDSNIILSLLGGHGEELEKSNTQLVELLKNRGITLRIFNFTLDEVINVIEGYFNEKHKFFKGYCVDSIYQNFKNKGYNDGKIYKLIAELDIIIKDKFGIILDNSVNYNKLDYDRSLYEIEELENKFEHSRLHDINALESIKKFRENSSPRIIELSKYIFLSYDKKLFLADCKVNDKSLTGKIPNIIHPEYLSNYIWLKKPDWESNLPIAMIFSSIHSHGLIDRDIWNFFYDIINEMSQEGEITKEDYMYLISNNEFKNELIVTENKNKINKEFILKSVSETKKEIENKTYDRLKIEFDENFEKGINKKENEIKLDIINRIKEEGKKEAKIYSIIIIIAIIVIYFLIAILIFTRYKEYFTTKWSEYEGVFTYFGWILGPIIGLIPFSSLFCYSTIKNFIFNKLVDKDINKYNLK